MFFRHHNPYDWSVYFLGLFFTLLNYLSPAPVVVFWDFGITLDEVSNVIDPLPFFRLATATVVFAEAPCA
jgi:hypothetical protein